MLHRAEISPSAAVSEEAEHRLIAQDAVAALAEQKSVWSIEDLEREVATRISSSTGRSAFAQQRAIESLARDVARTLCVDLVAQIETRSAERSLPLEPCLERYTTVELIEQEQRIVRWLAESASLAGHAAREDELARALARIAAREGNAPALDPAQIEAAALVAGTHRACVIEGPAGAGKTTTLKLAVEVLDGMRAHIVGLAPTAVAAERLERATGISCKNVAEYLTEQRGQAGARQLHTRTRGDALIVDEAGMLNTPDFEALLRVADDQRLRVVLIGDHRQLAPVGRGGMFEHARELLPTVELTHVRRFEHEWEAAASLQLRAGEPAALDRYVEHGRVVAGPAERVYDAMLADWERAHETGGRHAFNVPTNEQARHLNARAQQRLIAAGAVSPSR